MHHQELITLGRIVAESAHDLNNVLAVTRDAGGLLRDILALIEGDVLPHRDKLARIVDSVDRQTKRGAAAAKALNRFAHLADEKVGQFEIAELLPLTVQLTARHAASHQVTLVAEECGRRLRLVGSPLRTLLLLAACLRACVESCADNGSDGEIHISAAKAGKAVEVRFVAAGDRRLPLPALPNEQLEDTGTALLQEDGDVVLRFKSANASVGRRMGLWSIS